MTTIDLIYFNAGGGHRAAALALEAVIAEQRRPWSIRLVNLVDLLDPTARFRRVTGAAPEDFYNRRLATGMTFGMAQELKLLQGVIRLGHAKLVAALRPHWLQREPDLVVSLIPNFNRALCESLCDALPGVPFATVLTDMADYPPNFWIEPDQPQHLVCGTGRAVQQALEMGCDPARVHATSGMLIRPDFYRPNANHARQQREAFGLDPDRPTGLVLFGGHGSKQMLSIARQMADVQLVLLCGHNVGLAERLRMVNASATHLVVGFTQDVRSYMHASDFFIGKPGPGSISEALQQGLPIVTVRNAWTMPQERYNTEWIAEQQLGLLGPSLRKLRPTVDALVERLDEFRNNVAQVRNRAVFELPDILQRIIERAGRRERAADGAAHSSRVALTT